MIPLHAQFANFCRHHDELNLGMLSDSEREEVFAAFAPEPAHREYGRGIRRRLAPMLGNDQRRIRLALALTMALPGTPVLMYGDEIGMGEDLSLPGRLAVRNPMQWSGRHAGGFSTADELYRPVHAEGPSAIARSTCPTSATSPARCIPGWPADPCSPRVPGTRLGRNGGHSWSVTRACWPSRHAGVTAAR